MGYFDRDLTERRHRFALFERKFNLYSMYLDGGGSLSGSIADEHDHRLRQQHEAFLDQVRMADVGWLSPRLRTESPDTIEQILQKVRTARQSTHLTTRRGSVLAPFGSAHWIIRKPATVSELLKAAWTRRPFKLELWHPGDVDAGG